MTENTILVTSRDAFTGSVLVDMVEDEHIGTICEFCSKGPETLKAVEHFHPTVLVLDLFLPLMNGLSILRELREIHQRFNTPRILAYCHSLNRITGVKAVKLGCTGLADFSYTVKEARQVFCKTARGISSYPPDVKELIDDNDFEKNPQKYTPVTTRQSQIVELVSRGLSNQEIGFALEISIKTVEKHKRVIKKKYDLYNSAEITHFAILNGIIEKEEGICM